MNKLVLVLLPLSILLLITFYDTALFFQEYSVYAETVPQDLGVWDLIGNIFTEYGFQVVGLFGVAISAIVVGVVGGIDVVGSGLSEHSVKLLSNSVLYFGLWGIFSSIAIPLILEIPMYFGVFIYAILTLMYIVGVISMSNSGD